MRLRVAFVAAVVPLALAAAAGARSAQTPALVVQQAALKTAAAGTQHVRIAGSVSVAGQPVTIGGSGRLGRSAGALQVQLAGGAFAGTLDAVVDAQSLYLRSPLLAGLLPPRKHWLRVDLAQAAKSRGVPLGSLAQGLAQLSRLSQVSRVGPARLGGVATTRYRGRLAQQLGAVDVWVGSDGYVRRVQLATAAGAPQPARATLDLSGFGRKVSVRVPSRGETYDAPASLVPGLGK